MTTPSHAGIPSDGESIGLYLHVPFCKSKCPYCDFCSHAPESGAMGRYVHALDAEIRLRTTDRPLRTIYFGGGTPSFLGSERLCRIIESVRRAFDIQADCEFTVEANSADVTAEWSVAVHEAGVNRLSLGVQGLRDEDLWFLGRRHTVADAVAAAQYARAAGFENLGIDIIIGLPGHTADTTRDILTEAVAAFEPEHLSCYQLTCAAGTPLYDAVERGEVVMPDAETQAEVFMATHRTLEELGYEGYEVSNFARTRALRSRHNLAYWTGRDYLGLGPSAHSFQSPVRLWNTPSFSRYCELLEQDVLPAAGEERLTGLQRAAEIIMLGLRTRDGFSLETLRLDCDVDLLVEKGNALRHAESEGLLHHEADRILPTLQGMAVADGLAVHLTP